MTVIACRNGTMACDSCWNSMDIVDVLANKIERLPSGAILGQSGSNDIRGLKKLLGHVKTGKQIPSLLDLMATREDADLLLLLPNGEMWKISNTNQLIEHYDGDLGVWQIQGYPYAAVGHGWELAMGALASGASAYQACAAAVKHDTTCRGPIHTLSILRKKPK